MKKVLALLVVAAMTPIAALAQQPGQANGIVTTLDGTATIARSPNVAPARLQYKDPVSVGNRIETQKESIVKVLMGGRALITVRELSALTITEDAGKATVNLTGGKVRVQTIGFRSGESVEIRTPNAIASVRGSIGIVEVSGPISHIDNAGGNVLGAPLGGVLQPIPPLQGLTITGNVLGPLRAIRPDATAGFQSKNKPGQGQKPANDPNALATDLSSLGGGAGNAMPGASSGGYGTRVLPGNPKSGVYVP